MIHSRKVTNPSKGKIRKTKDKDWNPGPSYCKAAVLPSIPQGCPIFIQFHLTEPIFKGFSLVNFDSLLHGFNFLRPFKYLYTLIVSCKAVFTGLLLCRLSTNIGKKTQVVERLHDKLNGKNKTAAPRYAAETQHELFL